MELKTKKRLAAEILKCSKKRITFDPESLKDIKEAITKSDIRSLIKEGIIQRKNKQGVSRVRARKRALQKRKGRQKGHGSRKGKKTARLDRKLDWMHKVRAQRNLLRELRTKGKLSNQVYHELYMKIKGGFFRSRRHVSLYIQEHKLIK